MERGLPYFAPRRPGSVWARADGSWSILMSEERLEVPEDLAAALAADPPAQQGFTSFPPSTRRTLLSCVADRAHCGVRCPG